MKTEEKELKQEDISQYNIYKRLLLITSDMKRVAKNLDVGIGKNSYKATGEADVLAAVKELENKYGIYSYPFSREIIEKEILETTKEYNGNINKGNQIFLRIMTVYRFVNIDKPEEFIDITTYGDGIDTQDKAPGKAMTYGDKYALMKAYKIITGDDPDQNKSPDNTSIKKEESKVVMITPNQLTILQKLSPENQGKICSKFKKEVLQDLTSKEASEIIQSMMNKAKERKGE